MSGQLPSSLALASFIPPRELPFNIEGGKEKTLPVEASYFYVKEANYSNFDFKLDLGDWISSDLATGHNCGGWGTFRQISFRNRNVAALELIVIVGFGDPIDNRLNLIASRDGTAASMVPPTIEEEGITLADAAAVELLPADPNRKEAWLWTDEASSNAWWGVDNAVGTEDFRRIGQSIDGFTKIPAKCAVWVRASAGVKIGAQVFKF